MIQPVDFDLHGLVGIRLLEATPEDVAIVSRQLGPIQSALIQEPDILIRFVDQLPLKTSMRYLGLDDVAFTEDAFLVLRSKHKSRAKVQIPFQQIGKQCEIICERGLPAVPLLIPIVNLTALGKGTLPLHASAFNYNQVGVLTTGWSKGGKTETLLAFMTNGAEYVGDEWVYLQNDGQRMVGIPEPIRVWDWHLDYLPHYRTKASRRERTRLQTLKVLTSKIDRMTEKGNGHSTLPLKMMNRMKPLLKKQLHIDWPPEELFGAEACAMTGSLDKVFFVASHESSEVTIQPMDPQELARRMVFSLQEEQMNFMSYYWKFRFAFPDAANPLIEQSEACQRETLLKILSGKDTYAVYHPYPVPIQSLFDIISPYCN